MRSDNAQIVYLVGTSTGTRGGIGYVIGASLASELKHQFRLVHIVTHRDGTALQKVWVYAKSVVQFVFFKMLHGGKLVHIHSSSGPSFLRKALFFLLSKALGCRVIFQIHSGGFIEYYEGCGKALRGLIRYVLNTSEHVVVLTDSWKHALAQLSRNDSNISVIGNPIDTSKYYPVCRKREPGQPPRLLFLGALIRNEGVYDILDCVRRLKEKGLEVSVTLAGDRELEQVRLHSQGAGIEELIDLPGWVSEATKLHLLRSSDLLLLPSYKEGLPLCVLEAMASGLPVICSSAGGLSDLIRDGENGFLMAPGDLDTMARHISALIRNASLREEMGRRNVRKVNELFTLPVIANKVSELYRNVLAGAGCHSVARTGSLSESALP